MADGSEGSSANGRWPMADGRWPIGGKRIEQTRMRQGIAHRFRRGRLERANDLALALLTVLDVPTAMLLPCA